MKSSSYPVLRDNGVEENLPPREEGPQEPVSPGVWNVTGAYSPPALAGAQLTRPKWEVPGSSGALGEEAVPSSRGHWRASFGTGLQGLPGEGVFEN